MWPRASTLESTKIQSGFFSATNLTCSRHDEQHSMGLQDLHIPTITYSIIVDKSFIPAKRGVLSPKFLQEDEKILLTFYIIRKTCYIREIYAIFKSCILNVCFMQYSSSICQWENQFLSICLWSSGKGLEATFIPINTVEEEIIEISFEFHKTQIQQLEVKKLEKKLGANFQNL